MTRLCLIATLLCAFACAPASDDPVGEPPVVERASCAAPIGGIAWESPVTESQPGFDNELAGFDLGALPAQLDTTALDGLRAGVLAYVLELQPLPAQLDRDELLGRGAIGEAVAGAFASARQGGDPDGLDFPFLRRGLHRFYDCARELPLTLDGFILAYGDVFSVAPEMVDSMPKGGPRRLFQDHARGLYAAQTLDADGAVRETEILLTEARRDGALEFVVYGSDGLLMDRSRFSTLSGGTVVGAAPYTCMTCHVDTSTWTFTVLFPDL